MCKIDRAYDKENNAFLENQFHLNAFTQEKDKGVHV